MPPLSWNEIKSRALAFSREWADEASEDAEAKTFWNAFFHVFGIERRRVASFEQRVNKLDGRDGYIDLLWKGMLLIEHKSRGKDLDRAHQQALGYFPGLKERELPRCILVSDFARFRLYDLEEDSRHDFALKDLHKNLRLFGFIAGYQTHAVREQDPVNIKAAERMGRLHDLMKETGYVGHALEVYLVRLLFCLFAEDTGIFQQQQFQDFIEQRTGEDGSDLGPQLSVFFHILNSPEDHRLKNLDEQLAAFPFVNGRLFEEVLSPASFDTVMRQSLLDCCGLDWSRISPAIFGSLFQSIMDKQARRNLGAHYTSEQNILKLIRPLFLDRLREEFGKVKGNRKKLEEFHQQLRSLSFLDPACGCGNFLVIAYRELRLLELDILRVLHTSVRNEVEKVQQSLDVRGLIRLNVDQFFGIELEEFPAQIAQVALWLTDHQMNQQVSEEFGLYFARIPLKTSPNIICGNALRLDWNEVVPVERLSYIMGNPPFVGAKFMSEAQRADVNAVFAGIKNAGLLDFVAAWYVKAAQMLRNTAIRCAFVSTNSICQGEQVSVLWNWLLSQGCRIFFAHRTFQWNNEARGKAAVHCVIVGFACEEVQPKLLFEYEDIRGEAHSIQAKNISPYLIDGPDIIVYGRMKPICLVQEIVNGSIPADGGNLIFTPEEKDEFLSAEPLAAKWIRPYLGAEGFIHNDLRYCLWLVDCPPDELQRMPLVLERVKAVRCMRQQSPKEATKEKANIPTLFTENRQPDGDYLAIPRTSSENRQYLPIGYLSGEVVAANDLQLVPSASLYSLGVLASIMHKAWVNITSGRLKNDIRYSVKFTYNTFPWPPSLSDKQQQAVEVAAQTVLNARAQFPDSSLADLYDPLTMPPVLLKAHRALDKAVDATYGRRDFKSEAERVAFLFDLYQKYTASLLPLAAKGKKPGRRKKADG
ncbi:MAG: Type II restriction/modification system, DNA methylase subunit YeeA [Candidatus Electronema aureum]|uniref:site-specific DNA-methyltransferase (adenine-specific) n=1 Tax=Candidatus Electronema aureum TaxID=2005002 RepID=A0A521G4F3_9BACT|nr:MAG: Type II restriction/modification system, DNA methylase subunit YeeA [Candidatus Electronema aureum]